jgi:hypothetical protein
MTLPNKPHTFRDWINSQPYNERKKVVVGLGEACSVSPETVRKWIKGQYSPKPFYRQIINTIAGTELIYEDKIKKVKIA